MSDIYYDQLCQSYRYIDEFRTKLLGFLPLATGAGILIATKEVPASLLQHFSLPIAVFGFLITSGLFCFEIYGVEKCAELIRTGKKIELANNQGQFVRRPNAVLGRINEPLAAGIIYPAVLASWVFVAFMKANDAASAATPGSERTAQQFSFYEPSWIAWVVSLSVFVGGFTIVWKLENRLKKMEKALCDGCGCELESRKPDRARTCALEPDYCLCRNCSKSLACWLQTRRALQGEGGTQKPDSD
ncbi:MAG TPA: hypothetical protein VFA40_03535 [Terriglobales bacterium]|nr:hypothetical protein [Terriglobales bacterium]